MSFALPGFDLERFVHATLAEDLGDGGDITSAAVIPADAMFRAVMHSRDAIVAAGLPIAEAFFRALDAQVAIERLVEDGARVAAGTDLLRVTGKARALLTAERSALNTLQHLSGIATLTRAYVDAIAGTGATLLDTRKTIPGLRVLEKYATRMGGAQNHRMGLWDAAMIKDNHVAVAGGVNEAVRRAVAAGIERIIVEVDRIDQIEPALTAGATHLLLDNMGPDTLRQAVALGRRARADRGQRRGDAGDDPRQGGDGGDLHLGRPAYAIRSSRGHRAGFRSGLAALQHPALDHPRFRMVLVEISLQDLEVAGVGAERKVEQVADQRDRPDCRIEADIAGHAGELELGQAQVARFPDEICAEPGGDHIAYDRDQPDDRIEPDRAVDDGQHKQSLEAAFQQLESLAHRGRVAAERKRCSVNVEASVRALHDAEISICFEGATISAAQSARR
jgi:nicotinate-nucleotide pyrophosphorylase (carboxylating)